MIKIRKIKQDKTPGTIYLHSMPGRGEELIDEVLEEIGRLNISAVISLTAEEEIERKSPDFMSAIKNNRLDGVKHIVCPVKDFGIPEEESLLLKYKDTVSEALNLLEADSCILIHCGAGIGRTGTFAVILLKSMGYSYNDALQKVKEAGSGPETREQEIFCSNWEG